MKTLVLGLGNPILSDDGVGIWVAEMVRRALPPGTSVEVSEASVGGLALMERMVGYDRVILIDALQTTGGQPGTIRRLTLTELASMNPTQHVASAHDTNLITALEMGQRMQLALPREVIIFGIEVEKVFDFGERPTPAVAAAVPRAAAAVLEELVTGEEEKSNDLN